MPDPEQTEPLPAAPLDLSQFEGMTGPPWTYTDKDGQIVTPEGVSIGCAFDNPDTGLESIDEEPSYKNGLAMAAAPKLIAELRAVRAENAELNGMVERDNQLREDKKKLQRENADLRRQVASEQSWAETSAVAHHHLKTQLATERQAREQAEKLYGIVTTSLMEAFDLKCLPMQAVRFAHEKFQEANKRALESEALAELRMVALELVKAKLNPKEDVAAAINKALATPPGAALMADRLKVAEEAYKEGNNEGWETGYSQLQINAEASWLCSDTKRRLTGQADQADQLKETK